MWWMPSSLMVFGPFAFGRGVGSCTHNYSAEPRRFKWASRGGGDVRVTRQRPVARRAALREHGVVLGGAGEPVHAVTPRSRDAEALAAVAAVGLGRGGRDGGRRARALHPEEGEGD